jgi:hypothetical protein
MYNIKMDYEYKKRKTGKSTQKDKYKYNGGYTSKHVRIQEAIKEKKDLNITIKYSKKIEKNVNRKSK